MDWYEENIEEPIRELVHRLRDNGINTICSCGHEMYVQAEIIPDASLKVIHDIVYGWLSEKEEPNYIIEIRLDITKGIIFQCYAEIRIGE